MSNIRIDLTETMIARRRLQKVRRHYDKLAERLARESEQVELLSRNLKKEERDVARLEKAGLRSMFRRILGDREKQLEIERQEYLQAALKFNELTKSLELIEYEMGLLEQKLDNEDFLEERYHALVRSREQELLKQDSQTGRNLLRIFNEIEETQVVLRDVSESIDAGGQALQLLQKLEGQLRKAHDWGQWDMYGRSGNGWMKHQAIDRARDYLHRVRHALIRFENELRDVYPDARINIDIRVERIDRFFDVFFDNLITDWIVQQKIMNALQNVRTTYDQILTALRDLDGEIPRYEKKLKDLQKERETLVVTS